MNEKEFQEKYGKTGPWYLMYLFLIPFFLIAIVPEGFFTWQMMLIFAVMMSVPFIVMWWLYSDNSPKNKKKSKEDSL
jgi:4-hydroxybenzoate polyprenyltransferase